MAQFPSVLTRKMLALGSSRSHYRAMHTEPPLGKYHADTAIHQLSDWIGEEVSAADFPDTVLRFRNDRAASSVGLADLADADWTEHFGRFTPLPDNLASPLALKYHGHQFRVYNPEIGDGRGFLFAQMRDANDRLMDLGTKGSGQTPFSRAGDGRLTLKGAVREIMATEMLEALGVNTSKTLSVVETGEKLWREDEPSPARSAVMVRLSHSHIRIGTFQRLLAHEEQQQMEALVKYCITHFPGPLPPDDAPARDEPAIILLHQVVERMADLAASYMVAGFVHGVLNTDNMNVTGESFDYGPWRWLPRWEPSFTAAYFDHSGLYAFGRQPEALNWNCGQLAVALRLIADSEPLIAALNRFPDLYMASVARRWCWRLGVVPQNVERDTQLVSACEKVMRDNAFGPDAFFFKHRGGRAPSDLPAECAQILAKYATVPSEHAYWAGSSPQSMLIEEVETIWSAIADRDDWTPLKTKVENLRKMGAAHGPAPSAAGHASTP